MLLTTQETLAQYSFYVTGTVYDQLTSLPLSGANIFLKDKSAVVVSDKSGKFDFHFTNKTDSSAIILIQYIGYKTKEIHVNYGNNKIEIKIEQDIINQKEVEVSESRIPQRILESPITMMRIDAKTIEQLPQENFYAALGSQKGVNVNANSVFYKTIQLRGFSLLWNEGNLQLLDGMDNLPPGQGFSVGNLDGTIDLDVDNIEIIPGAGSAIYGANAFNGLINVTSKGPYRYEGLSVQLKTGSNFIDGKYHSPALFYDNQIRYAKSFRNRFAFKFTIGYAKGTDWLKLSQTDFDIHATNETRGLNNPGRDISNIYGDEVQQALPIGVNGSDVYVSRTGYNANDLLGTNSNVFKMSPSIYYKFKNETELSYNFYYTLFNSNVSWADWNFRNFSVMYNKVELKNKNFFVRLYNVNDHDGNSFSSYSVAIGVNNKWKNDSVWFNDYTKAFLGNVSGVLSQNHDAARSYADIGMLQPGTDAFNKIADEQKNIYGSDGGARFADESGTTKFLAQYDFSHLFSYINIISGIDMGQRILYSRGTMFMDYPPKSPIHNDNYSGYIQLQKEIFKQRLNVVASGRYDKYNVHTATITPRIATVYKIDTKNFLRASFQTGSRVPDPFDEYQFWSSENNYGVGGTPFPDQRFHLHERSFDYNSYDAFSKSVNSYVAKYGIDSLDHAVQLYKNILKPSGLEYIQPEHLTNYEAGYQSLLMHNKLHIDINFFYSIYPNRILYTGVVMPRSGNPFNADSLDAAASSFANDDYDNFYLPVNAKKKNLIYGMEAGMEYNIFKEYVISGNITWQQSETGHDDYNASIAHVTPLKTNVNLSNPALYKNIGFSINWNWIDSFNNFTDPKYPFINNFTPANNIIDAQITFSIPKVKSTIRFGASNLLNHYYTDLAQGSSAGGIYYVSLVYGMK